MSATVLTGLTQGARAFELARMVKEHPRLLILSADEISSQNLLEDFIQFNPDIVSIQFRDWDTIPFELANVAIDASAARIQTVLRTVNLEHFCIFAALPAVLRKIIPAKLLSQLSFNLQSGQTYERTHLLRQFLLAGYRRVSLVQSPGDLAVRGNVIDFFPAQIQQPLRLEFFDNVLEHIKVFDAASQRSSSRIQEVIIDPLRELYPLGEIAEQFDTQTVPKLKALASQLEVTPRETARVVAALRENLEVPGIELYTQMALNELHSLFDYLPKNLSIVLDSSWELQRAQELALDQINTQHSHSLEQGNLVPPPKHVFLDHDEVQRALESYARIYLDQPTGSFAITNANKLHYDYKVPLSLTHAAKNSAGSVPMLQTMEASLKEWLAGGYRIFFLAGSHARCERISVLLAEIGLTAQLNPGSLHKLIAQHVPGLFVCQGHLSESFSSSAEKLVIFAETQLFQRKSLRKGGGAVSPALKKILNDLEQLNSNDYVVHEDYGIGQFMGLVQLNIDGNNGDFLQIEYADSTLYLPAHNINKIQKYMGVEGVIPELDRLSAGKWNKTKAKVQKAVAEIAGDLLNLYAQRAVASGFKFDDFNELDQEFADQFAYDETSDQLAAIHDTLSDMASDKPMDRLVCGDVGFGKTEVAIRAAFKAIQAGKQVAVLAPTTILVEQHFNSFQERFRSLGVRIGVLSRFHGNKANQATLAALASGELDIIIGTHKLLGRTVNFKDLGLLVVDEEHRFGVKQKEQLKTLKRSVDVLTLTATPIPRTLHMAMCQVRDISIISTPPIDRRVIQTHVAQRDENLIRSVLLREHQRGGQSFFVHNRVQTLPTVLAGLKELCPELRFGFGHGQMKESQLEDSMRSFIAHETDVLVCTSIIESGLDIPNANSILIDRADTFGLAQLYQLRGRVGRSSQQAYCYFLVPPIKQLNADAHKRLKALQNLDDLGLGFNLALRDLEIRGAGNILGREQSGNVFLVGYELYSKILNDAIMNLKGEPISLAANIDPEIKLAHEAFLPEFYIPDISERLLMYQRLSAVLDFDQLDRLIEELEDRFGAFGREVQNLLELMRLRVLCRNFGIVKLEKARERLYISFHPQAPIAADKILGLVKDNPDQYRLAGSQGLSIPWQREYESCQLLLNQISKLCRAVKTCQVLNKVHTKPVVAKWIG